MPSLSEIALTFIPGVGSVTARNLISYFGTAENVFSAKNRQKLMSVPGVGPKTAECILKKDFFKEAEKELGFVERYKIETLFFTSEKYPKRLRNCYDAPLMLYFKGKADLNASRIVSIVGTRNATDYGKSITQELVEGLKQHDVLVVSGLAYGIDGIAHKACLKHHIPTVGVVGHGLDRIYPSQHRSLAEKMLSEGGLLTEFPSETIPDRENFPKRNRIVAGMSDATIIVEASVSGGALITAELANSYNRDVFAFPGSVFEEYSSGCNYLIKTNRAHLITSVKDVEFLLGWLSPTPKDQAKQTSLFLNLSEDEQKLADVLKAKGACGVDDLSLATDWPQSKLAVTILALEMQGIIVTLPGKLYKLA